MTLVEAPLATVLEEVLKMITAPLKGLVVNAKNTGPASLLVVTPIIMTPIIVAPVELVKNQLFT